MIQETIKPQELRIGNWVTSAGQNSQVLIINGNEKAFDQVYLERQYDFEWTEFSKIEGIPLTSDILLKAKFQKTEAPMTFKIQLRHHDLLNLYLTFEPRANNIISLIDKYGHEAKEIIFTNVPCQYLHQLQNLIFALTGTELKIDL